MANQLDFEPVQEEALRTPDSRELAGYEEYARRELPRLVRASVLEVFSREMQPVEASLIANLVDTIQECQARIFRSYSQKLSEDQEADLPSSSMADPATGRILPSPQFQTDEGNSIQTPCFLNAAFQQPPDVQDTGFEPNFPTPDSIHSLHTFNLVDISLVSPGNKVFSDPSYDSERSFNCQYRCSSSGTTIGSQGQVGCSNCPAEGTGDRGDSFGWQDWTADPDWTDPFSVE